MLFRSVRSAASALLLASVFAGCHRTEPVSTIEGPGVMQFTRGPIAVNPPDWSSQSTPDTLISKTMPASKEISATVHARLVKANESEQNKGDLEFVVDLVGEPQQSGDPLVWPPQLVIKMPLSSSADAYGESRSCFIDPNGVPHYRYTAGLDEDNFVSFAPMASDREFKFSLNKYLCRALAVPYSCKRNLNDQTPILNTPADISHWQIRGASVAISSTKTPARADVSAITLASTGKPFDYATCAKVAPSDGMCCVAHKQTEWHCGTKPEGKGWRQVSGSCYHRETGASCSD